MKNKSEKIYRFLSFVCSVALAAYIILYLHHLTESASYMSGATYKFLVGAELVLLIIVFIRIFWAFRKLREVGKGKKCETKINQNVQKKTNLKTSLNNLEKIE